MRPRWEIDITSSVLLNSSLMRLNGPVNLIHNLLQIGGTDTAVHTLFEKALEIVLALHL
jgi:hypothetical protein